jgi:hypothetical protein
VKSQAKRDEQTVEIAHGFVVVGFLACVGIGGLMSHLGDWLPLVLGGCLMALGTVRAVRRR